MWRSQMLHTTSQAPMANSAAATATMMAVTGLVSRVRRGGRCAGASRRSARACSGSRRKIASTMATTAVSAAPKMKIVLKAHLP